MRAREPVSLAFRPPRWSEEDEGEEDTINPYVSDRERSDLLSDSENELGSDEDDDLKEPEAKKRFTPSEGVQKLLSSMSSKPLKNERRRTIINKLPMPASDPAHPPKLDEAVSSLVPKSAKSHDKFLSKLQRYTLDAMGPLIWMLDQFQQGNEIDPKVGKGAIRSSLCLLGNASAHFNVERRKALMKHLNKDLRPLAEGEFPDKGANLFGEDFGKRAKSMADNIRALKGVQYKKPGLFSGYGDSNRRFPSSRHQSRRQNWGAQSAAKRSVFQRLDAAASRQPQQNRRSDFPPKQQQK